jgi:probable blue pigment (indigoidine) exporter
VLSKQLRLVGATAVAPLTWGTTYLVTTELLPPDRPLTAAALRALPAGLLILAVTRTLPHGIWWLRSLVLGTLNIGAFFALLFVAAYRLPGAVAATIGAIGPLVVAALAAQLLRESFTRRRLTAGLAGILGVALLVGQAGGRLDPIGIVAAVGGVFSMATGIVLTKKWGQPERPLATTAWQLIAGGLVLLPLTIAVEGLPDRVPTLQNVVGYGYLSLIGAVLAYALWFRGISALPAGSVSFLSLLSPVVAVLAGWLVLDQTLSVGQFAGVAIIGVAVLSVTLAPPDSGDTRRRASRDRQIDCSASGTS